MTDAVYDDLKRRRGLTCPSLVAWEKRFDDISDPPHHPDGRLRIVDGNMLSMALSTRCAAPRRLSCGAARSICAARHAEDKAPLDAQCACPACASYSRTYLHHLCRCGEILASMLLTWHNLSYYQDLMTGRAGGLRRRVSRRPDARRRDVGAMPTALALCVLRLRSG